MNLSAAQLRQAAGIQEQIESLQEDLDQLLRAEVPASTSTYTPEAPQPGKMGKKPVSEAKLRALDKAREARWARFKAAKRAQAQSRKVSQEPTQKEPKKKRRVTAAVLRGLAKARAARSAKAKAALDDVPF